MFYKKELSRSVLNQIPRNEIYNMCTIEAHVLGAIFETIRKVLTYMERKLTNGQICHVLPMCWQKRGASGYVDPENLITSLRRRVKRRLRCLRLRQRV